MASVWYIGQSNSRIIDPEEWAEVGITSPAYAWVRDNGWSVPKAEFTAAQILLLSRDSNFWTEAPDGPRVWSQVPGYGTGGTPGGGGSNDEVLQQMAEYLAGAELAETTAEGHATAAAGSAAAASGHAATASGAASAAQGHAGNAQAAQTAAEGARDAALGHKDAAETAAGTATTKAGEASTSAGEAAASASTANLKAGEAASSEAVATTKAGEAAASATQALGYRDEVFGALAGMPERDLGDIVAVYTTGDFNTLDFTAAGNYQVQGGTGYVANAPTTTAGLWWNVVALNGEDPAVASKLFIATTTTASSIYARVKYGSTWGGWVNITAPFAAMSVSEGKTGTATTSRAVRADYLKQIINFYITGNEATGASSVGQSLASAVDAIAARAAIGAEAAANKGIPNGYTPLDANGFVPANHLPGYVDDVLEYAALGSFPAIGESGKIYVAIDTGKTYRWSGTLYAEISPSDVNSVAGKTGSVTLVANDISDATTTGKNILKAANGGAVRTEIGAAPATHTHVRTDISDSTTIGRALMGAPDAATARGEIGAGTSSLTLGTASTNAMAGNRLQVVTSLPGTGVEGVWYGIPE